MKGYEDLNIRIKWQNDIYFGCEAKIGGGLVDVHMNEHTVLITTGK
jgi:biotin-(acetyl-CoA carboxylase) ligase